MRKTLDHLRYVTGLTSCGRESPLGFRLPDGKPDAEQQAFVALRCGESLAIYQ